MQPTYSAEAEAYREKVQAFLAEHLPAGWQGTGALEGDAANDSRSSGGAPSTRTVCSRSAGRPSTAAAVSRALEQVIVAEEFTKAGVPSGVSNDGFGIQMVGNTILQWGSEEQKQHYLPRILSGEDIWCQGYSEPNAGSDLAQPRVPRRCSTATSG